MQSSNDLIAVLKKNRSQFYPVVPFDPQKDSIVAMDFTAANTALTDELLKDTAMFAAYVESVLLKSGARYGIGGYAEHRTIYRVSNVFDSTGLAGEPRTVHLGTDIWGPAGTPVMAPLDSIIHSFAFNDRFGDYGATIILSHILDGLTFYTLYGHLSLISIQNCSEGQPVQKGTTFATFGIPEENGHWPPHLHFQVINDLKSNKGDYPGVCTAADKRKYLANCPDPGLLLAMKP
ncbi:MAG: peptidoglycan DD-metalloendopeptidase family protein [Chitinophagaceae bacterium]